MCEIDHQQKLPLMGVCSEVGKKKEKKRGKGGGGVITIGGAKMQKGRKEGK